MKIGRVHNGALKLAAVVTAAGILGFVLFSRPNEPSYDDRTLTEWLEDAKLAFIRQSQDPERVELDPEWQSAKHAVKQRCAAALPFLLTYVQAKDSKSLDLTWKLIYLLRKYSFIHFL